MPDTRETLVAMRERLVADLAALQDGFVKTQGGIATVDKMLAELDAGPPVEQTSEVVEVISGPVGGSMTSGNRRTRRKAKALKKAA